MAEKMTLPRSGIVLDQARPGVWSFGVDWVVTMIRDPFVGSPTDRWVAAVADEKDDFMGTRDECLAWLDARVLALRAALLPADARELIAKALDESFNKVMSGPSCECECEDDECRPYDDLCIPCKAGPRYMADAVLAALGGGT